LFVSAHSRAGLVTLLRQSNQRRFLSAQGFFALAGHTGGRTGLYAQKQASLPRLGQFCRATLSLYYPACKKAAMPLVAQGRGCDARFLPEAAR